MTGPRPERVVLVTRSEPGASELARALEGAGHRAVVIPLVDVESVAPQHAPRRADVVIFTSVHAVARGLPAVAQLCESAGAVVVAVGAATAAALVRCGLPAVAPELETSEGILGLPALARPQGLRVVIVGGVGGRRLLDAALLSAGAVVERLEVYRRVVARQSQVGEQLAAGGLGAVVVSSAAAGDALADAVQSTMRLRPDLLGPDRLAAVWGLPVIVPSERVAATMRARGFSRVIRSAGAGPAAVVAALESMEEVRHGE